MSSEPETTDEAQELSLVQILRALPKKDFSALVRRIDAAVDPAKRIDVPSQVARVLLLSGDLKDPSRLGRASADLFIRLAENRGRLVLASAPPGLDPLVSRGLAYPRKAGSQIEILLPIAFMLQMKSWAGEDTRSARSLLSQASAEVQTSIASHYLGRTVAPPLSLALEPAFEVLTSPERLSDELQSLPAQERKLLHKVEEVGGEVDTDDHLEL